MVCRKLGVVHFTSALNNNRDFCEYRLKLLFDKVVFFAQDIRPLQIRVHLLMLPALVQKERLLTRFIANDSYKSDEIGFRAILKTGPPFHDFFCVSC